VPELALPDAAQPGSPTADGSPDSGRADAGAATARTSTGVAAIDPAGDAIGSGGGPVASPAVSPEAPAGPGDRPQVSSEARAGPGDRPQVSPTPDAGPAASAATAGPEVDGAALREAVWTRVQLARNVRRPHTLELLAAMATDVIEIHGDRFFGDDPAIVAGFATIGGFRIAFVGHQKGADVEENIRRNFGMPHPEGYRKAMRTFRLAERFGLPIVTFVDTPGASPDAASEERGQAEAIARSIMVMTGLRTPIVTVITGEGGSGGALAIAVGDVVIAFENAIYSVISPEGCASILWRSPEAAQQAAVAMRLTAGEQQALGVIDAVVPEPAGGAQVDADAAARELAAAIADQLQLLVGRDPDELVAARYARYRGMGAFTTAEAPRHERRERRRVVDRIRDLLSSGRTVVATGDTRRAAPPGADAADAPLHEEI
jgi:acetyl-CoA carboxylase carboxyl transferase subunit alpha